MTETDCKADERWCELGEGRYGEYGVIGAEQADESHLDDRLGEEDGDEDDFGADGKIHFATDKLYGREKELAQCRELFDTNANSAVFVSGYSGSGKSRVVEEFVFLNSNGTDEKKPYIMFLHSKSEAMQANVPFSSISSLFDHLDKSTSEECADIRDEIQETLGSDTGLILKVFPKLEKFLAKDGRMSLASCSSKSDESIAVSEMSSGAFTSAKKQDVKRRIMFALQVFFRTLSLRSKHRLCLCIDDLQWIDSLTMELIESILTDNTIGNLFFFGAFRSNEVDEGHMLIKKMKGIKEKREEKGLKNYLCIELKELHKEAIGEFIADSLRLSFVEALPLTNAVFTKTLGNPFFTRQALEYLVLKNALFYDIISFRWDWKLQEKELQDLISDDLLRLIKVKIEHLEPGLQEVLETASCTRSTFDVEIILVLLNPKFLGQSESLVGGRATEEDYEEEKLRVIRLLNQAVVEGLLVPKSAKRSSNLRRTISVADVHKAICDEYSFAHDKIRETVRSLISTSNNEFEFLERIGYTLSHRAQCPLYGEDWMFFTACEHLNRVATHSRTVPAITKQEEKKSGIMDEEQQFQLAVLNLRTAELSIDLLSFHSALDVCKHGISCLPTDEDERWSERYHDMTLRLFSIAAQATYGIGDMGEAERYCSLVISQRLGTNPKVTTIEAMPVYLIYLDIAGDKGEKEAGLQLALQILRELGTTAPKNKHKLRAKVWWSLKQIKNLYLPTEESIQNMPHVTDPFVANKMELMQKACGLAFAADETYLYMLLNCESVKDIYKHGLTYTSAASIASFANFLMHIYDDFQTSPKLAELAIHIADRQQSKHSETHPLNTANNNVLGWVLPLSSRLKYHDRAYNSGIISGNISGAMIGKWFGFKNKFMSSCIPLPELEEQFRASIGEMRRMKQNFVAGIVSIAWQVTLNLIGKSGNPNTTVLTGEAIDESIDLSKKDSTEDCFWILEKLCPSLIRRF